MQDFKKSVVYQIYPKSFLDTNGDGLGELRGVTSKLDYLKELGADYIWLTPFFVSPQNDNGYDVADYRTIDPRYGTMEDFEELARQAERRGIRLMLDMVFNHTSTEHVWFQKALAGDPVYQDYYIFRPARPDGSVPTTWQSKFGGSAWEYAPQVGKYYLHLFDKTQADLNWENPAVRREVQQIVHFWMDKGVKGFRFDVVNLISKGEYADDELGDGHRFYTDGPRIHEFLQELNRESFGQDPEIVTVGEMSSTSMENCFRYAGADCGELSMVFSFHHLKVDFMGNEKWVIVPADFGRLKELLFSWQEGMAAHNAWNAVFWCNHDQPRVVSRLKIHARDNSRTPTQWTDGENGGFTTRTPWIGVNPNTSRINAASQVEDPDSIFAYYKALIRLRKEYDVFAYGDFAPVDQTHPSVLSYRREYKGQSLLCVNNFYRAACNWRCPVSLESYRMLLSNYSDSTPAAHWALRPYESVLLIREADDT